MGSKKVRTKPLNYNDAVIQQCINTVQIAIASRNWAAAHSAVDYAQSQLEAQYLTMDSSVAMLPIPTKAIAVLEAAGFLTVRSVALATDQRLEELSRFERGWTSKIKVEIRRILDAGGKVLVAR